MPLNEQLAAISYPVGYQPSGLIGGLQVQPASPIYPYWDQRRLQSALDESHR
jgi:hypothetical protein